MIRTPLLLALLLGTSASGIALAADTPATPAPRPAKLDTNGDGVIDRSEAAANPRLAAKFDELDKNKDGKLSRDELPRWQHGRRGHGGE
ncbi:EF-hand domain-containing protein, partial [Mesorhizobium sp. M8A.F.Ca.ET.161.01.1.1]